MEVISNLDLIAFLIMSWNKFPGLCRMSEKYCWARLWDVLSTLYISLEIDLKASSGLATIIQNISLKRPDSKYRGFQYLIQRYFYINLD